MKIISLDASRWTSPDDFYSVLLPELGAPDWHGHNLDALWDSLGNSDINQMQPPYAVEVCGSGSLSSEMKEFLARVAALFSEKRSETGDDVLFVLN